MTTPTHLKIVFRGIFVNTPEEWSFGLKFSRTTPAAPDAGPSDVSDSAVQAAASAFFNTGQFASSVKATEYRVYTIGTDGKMEGNPRLETLNGATGILGAGASHKYPPNVALCVTTEAVNRGHARFGRFYLPGPAQALGSDGRLSVADVGGFVDITTVFLKAIADAIDLPQTVNSSELLNVSAIGAGTKQTVDQIRIGRTLDQIERRRRSMVEDYQVSGHIDW